MAINKSANKFNGWFNNQFTKQRWLLLIFGGEGVEARRILYYPTTKSFREKKAVRFLKVNENNIYANRVFRIFAKIFFFPFRYKVMVVAPRKLCCSKYFTVSFDRKNNHKPIEANELAYIFSQNLWPIIESNKKEFMKDNDYEDLNILLVNSQAVQINADNKILPNLDDIFSVAVKKASVGMVQTLVYRAFFSSLRKTFPKRAAFREFHEYGFNLPLSILLYSSAKKENKTKKFISATVEEKETRIFIFDGKFLSYHDKFSFGRRSLYDALNHAMNVDATVFNSLMKKIVTQDMDPTTSKRLVSILDKELTRLGNGLLAFKKESKAQAVYVDGGAINSFLRMHPRYAPLIVDNSICNCGFKGDISGLSLGESYRADILCAIGLDKKDLVNVIATRQIRWLIPHSIEVK
jgi:hypothetical protein